MERDFGVLVDQRLDMPWPCVLTAQKSTWPASRALWAADSPPLLHAGEASPGVLHTVQVTSI